MRTDGSWVELVLKKGEGRGGGEKNAFPPLEKALHLQETKTRKTYKAASKLRERKLKPSFISTFRPAVHTNLSRKRSFSKTLFKRRNLKTWAFLFRVDELTN